MLPSVAADSADERHAGIRHTDAAELSFTNDGRITETVRNTFQQVCGDLGAGVYASHGYERSHLDGVYNTLKVLKGYLKI